MDAAHDFIVIGSGSAGATLAGRLAEDGRRTVLLLEAGPDDRALPIRMPGALVLPLLSERFNWAYRSEPEPNLNGRRIDEARGRVLGGSSSINGMNWVRGNPWDYDHWESLGHAGWSHAGCLPYFKRAESYAGGDDAFRGRTGPMRIERSPADHPLYQAIVAAGVAAGHDLNDDHNGYRQEGMHATQRNVAGGVRWNTANAYLHAPGPRANLTVLTGAHVDRIEFSGRRAVRVHARVGGLGQTFAVGREAILAAGAINSPKILMLSGVGDADLLRPLDIPVAVHLPEVGRGLKDHMAGLVAWRARPGQSLARRLGPVARLGVGARWLLFKDGLGASNYFEAGAFLCAGDGHHVPNVQLELLPVLTDLHHGGVTLGEGFQVDFNMLRPTSEGRVWIDTADPAAPPRFVFNYLATEADRREAIAAVRLIRALVAEAPLAPFRVAEAAPEGGVTDDAAILAFLRATAGTNYHPCRTCRMGPVCDALGLVHGLDNLRVVDASIMPEIVSGNLNAPIIMMAEKIADAVLGRPPLPPEPVAYHRGSTAAPTASPTASPTPVT